ncbi:MAG: ribbon-helix-helix protein, CopG family [Actinomycetota bacterium]
MTTVAFRLADRVVAAVDVLVAQGRYASRTEVVRAALEALLTAHKQEDLDRRMVEGYTRRPQTDDEVALAAAATRALIEEEPW